MATEREKKTSEQSNARYKDSRHAPDTNKKEGQQVRRTVSSTNKLQ
jgi:hypothetical protein